MTTNLHMQQLIASELNTGEKVLWSGQPDAKREALPAMVIFVFAVPWTVFSVNFMFKWSAHGGWDFASALFQGSFVLVGIAMLLSPLLVYFKSKRTIYAITNQRILIIRGGRSKTVQSYDETTIGQIERTERPDGSGDLTFAQKHTKDGDGDARTSVQDKNLFGAIGTRHKERVSTARGSGKEKLPHNSLPKVPRCLICIVSNARCPARDGTAPASSS